MRGCRSSIAGDDRDRPGVADRRSAGDTNIAADLDQGARGPVPNQLLDDDVGCQPLSEATRVERRATG